MRSVLWSSVIAVAAGFGLLAAGCSQSEVKGPQRPAPPSSPMPQKPLPEPPPLESKKAAVSDKSLPEGLAELPEADRILAVKQKICPVTGEALGSMGKPTKVEIKGRTVFLCCDGCEADLKKDPDKYLAKLDAAGKK